MMTADMKVTGRFDDAFASGAWPIIEKLVEKLRDVTVDMSEATDLDAAGLRALVYLHKRLAPHGCRVRVLGASGRLQGLFARFHLADLFIEGAAKPDSTALRSCFFGLDAPAPFADGTRARSEVKESGHEASKESGIEHVSAAKAEQACKPSRNVKAWLDASTVGGGELRGGDALKSYRRWAGKIAEVGDATLFRANLAAILGADRVISRKSGYVVRDIQLRRSIPRARERPGAAVHPLFGIPASSVGMEAVPAVGA